MTKSVDRERLSIRLMPRPGTKTSSQVMSPVKKIFRPYKPTLHHFSLHFLTLLRLILDAGPDYVNVRPLWTLL